MQCVFDHSGECELQAHFFNFVICLQICILVHIFSPQAHLKQSFHPSSTTHLELAV